MSNYIFAPPPTFGISEHSFVTWDNGFSEEELDKLIAYCDSLPKQKGTIDEDATKLQVRNSDVAWIGINNESQWIYDRLAYIARQLNGQFYKFDIQGFNEDFQYTVYQGSDAGHYTWHQDYNTNNHSAPRKLSLVLQLSDPSEYEGGDLEIMFSPEPTKIKKEKGFIAMFPSFMLHRVTPVTSGIRKTLVVWICGNSFK